MKFIRFQRQKIYGLFLFFWLLPTQAFSDKITIVADEWIPYNGKPKSPMPGYGIEIAKAVFAKFGDTVDYQIMPWNRALQATRNGVYNAVIGAYKYDAPDFVFPNEEFGISKTAFFVKKGDPWKYTGLSSLKGRKIGLIKDYSYGDEIDDWMKAHQSQIEYIYGNYPLQSSMKTLNQGRIDTVIADINVFKQKALSLNMRDDFDNAGYFSATHHGYKVYIAFSPKNPKSKAYAKEFDKGIQALKASGELDKILAKYGLTYWK